MKPMLAVNADLTKIKYPVYVQPKLDGIRVLVKDGVVYSRKLKPIPNKHVQKLFGHLHGFDGELIVGNPVAKDVFQVTTSGVMSEDGYPHIVFWVFDLWNRDYPYSQIDIFEQMSSDVQFVCREIVNNEEELMERNQYWVGMGWEGTMIRNPDSLYKFGRATVSKGELLKLKQFDDAEARIVGVEERMHNANEAKTDALGHTERSHHKANMIPTGMLGALVLEWENGDTFKVGTGFTEEQRVALWAAKEELTGKLCKYKYQSSGMKDKPRFPVFIGFRHEDDVD